MVDPVFSIHTNMSASASAVVNAARGIPELPGTHVIDPLHLLVEVSDPSNKNIVSSVPRSLLELGFRHADILRFAQEQGMSDETPTVYRYNDAARRAFELAEVVGIERRQDHYEMVNVSDLASGIFMSRSALIEDLMIEMRCSFAPVLDTLQTPLRARQRFFASIPD